MAKNSTNNWLNWIIPNKQNNVQPYSTVPNFMYIGGSATKTGETITPENALENPTVFACVSLLAQTIAQMPWGVSERGIVGYNQVKDHPLQKLLERPNSAMTDYELKHTIVVDLLTYGNAYLLKTITTSGKVIQLVPLRADQMTATFSAAGKPSYRHDNGTVYPADKVIHFRDFIGSSIDGLSKVSQCANLVAIDNAIDSTLAANFKNGTAISGVVSFPEDMPPEVKKEFGDAWAAKFGGQGTARGSVAVLDNGAEFKQVESQTPGDADLQALKQQTMTRIAAVFRVPAYAIEISDGSKYDNLSQRQSGFYRDSIAPIIKNISLKLTDGLIESPEFEIEFGTDELIRGDMQTASAVAVSSVTSGILTINEARALMGYPEMKEEPKVEENENE